MTEVIHPLTKPQILELQQAINAFAKKFNVPNLHVDEDGEWGMQSARAVVLAKKAIGYDKKYQNAHVNDQLLKRLRSPLNRGWTTAYLRATGLRARRELRRNATSLQERAYIEMAAMVGIMEHGGNNAGTQVAQIIAEAGGNPQEHPAWCAYGVDCAYTRAGSIIALRNSMGWYDPVGMYAGVVQVSKPVRGDLVSYDFGHQGMFVADLGDMIETIEANTGASGAVSDSTTGGDGVYRKHRSKSLVKHYSRITA